MGREYSREIEARITTGERPDDHRVRQPDWAKLVRNSDAKVPFTIKVVDSDEINAFAFPVDFCT